MDDVENTSVLQEVANPQTESTQEEAVNNSIQIEDKQERNWKELRRSKEEWERKAKIQEELLQRLMSQQATNQVSAPQEEDYLAEIQREEYVSGEKVAKSLKKQEENFKKQLLEVERKYEDKHRASLLQDLKKEHSDFDDVVTTESLNILETKYPRQAQIIAKTKDPYEMALLSYDYIKMYGISEDVPKERRVKEIEKKMEQNKKTVATPQAFDKRPIAQAYRLTEQEKKKLAEEMYHYAGMSGGY